jgi:pimeloyl-ACP methyl ester carboxylesterase
LNPAQFPGLGRGIRSRMVEGINGLRVHVLEAGVESAGRRCVLLLHGFPELAFSWRKVMPALAAAGFHVIAPDQRGYGLTSGWDAGYDGDLDSFRLLNLVRDALGLVAAFGYRSVAAVVGHDFGSPVAAWAALVRPDVFRSVVLMSAPFGGPPPLPFDTVASGMVPQPPFWQWIDDELTALEPPRKHYQSYYATRTADTDMRNCAQGVHAFLRAYYHMKSADWCGNAPFALPSSAAADLANMPRYYIMDAAADMAQTVAPAMPSAAEIAACAWLTEPELAVYSAAFQRTGFQGGLNWYRCRTPKHLAEMELYGGRTIGVPAAFIAGRADWGVYQMPGALERMETTVCTRFGGTHLVDGAGHWVQQEQPERVAELLVAFLDPR